MTDTTTHSVLTAPRLRWWAVVPAVVAMLALVTISVMVLLPAQLFAETLNPRLGVQQPAPYARVPASAESVNKRVVYTDLPDDVEVYETNGDFYFVTVSAPNQSVLSWLIGANEPVVDMLTEEGKFGRRTPAQNRQVSLQQMRTATQEAQYLALLVAGLLRLFL